MNRTRALESAAVGATGGFLSGLLGVGGGFVMVPMYVLWLRMDQKRAHATSLAAIAPIAITAAGSYFALGRIDIAAALMVLAGAVVGANTGVRLLARLPLRTIQVCFSILLVVMALRLLWSEQPHQLVHGSVSVILLVLVGYFAGVMAGLFGVGGGIVITPALMLTYGMQPAVARGTSLAVIIGTSLSGSLAHHKRGNIDWAVARASGLAGIPTALLSTYASTVLPERAILAVFSVILLMTAVRMARSAPH